MMDDKEEKDKIHREMRLPEGKTCNNCDWYHRCSNVIGLENSGSTQCDWHPSRFRELVCPPTKRGTAHDAQLP